MASGNQQSTTNHSSLHPEHLRPRLHRSGDRVVGLHALAGGLAHLLPELWVSGEGEDVGGPVGGGFGVEAGFLVLDDLGVGADRAGDDGEAGGHVLDDLEAAFAQRPVVQGRGGDADVAAEQQLGLALLAPGLVEDFELFALQRGVGDDEQLQVSGEFGGGGFERGEVAAQVRERGARADPDEGEGRGLY